MARKPNNTKTTSQQQLFDLAGAPPAPTVRTVRYGDALLTTTETGPRVSQATTTDTTTGAHGFQPGTTSEAVNAVTTTTTATPSQPVEIIAGKPDRKKPQRWQVHTLSTDAGQIEARLGKFADGLKIALDIVSDGRGHHADELYAAVGGRDPGRVVREIRKLVGRTTDGRVVYAWLVTQISSTTGAGIYTLTWRDVPQPKGNNGAGVGDTL